MCVFRFEVSAKDNQGVSEAGKYLIDAIMKLESTIEKDDFDHGSAFTLHEESLNKTTSSKCCS